MRKLEMLVLLVLAALICMPTIPAFAADCNIQNTVTTWTRNKKALSAIRVALKDLTKRFVSEGGPTGDYSDAEFGGATAKQSFVDRVKARQAEFSIAILLLAGRNTTCYVCPVKPVFPIASDAAKACSDLIAKVKRRPGYEKTAFNCDKVPLFSRFDLTEPKLGSEFWDDVRFRQRHLSESLDQQPNTYEGDAVVSDSISRLRQQLEPFVKVHVDDPDRDQFLNDVRTTGCPGYEAYITGTETW